MSNNNNITLPITTFNNILHLCNYQCKYLQYKIKFNYYSLWLWKKYSLCSLVFDYNNRYLSFRYPEKEEVVWFTSGHLHYIIYKNYCKSQSGRFSYHYWNIIRSQVIVILISYSTFEFYFAIILINKTFITSRDIFTMHVMILPTPIIISSSQL